MKVLVLYNSKSGSGDKDSLIKELITYLVDEGVALGILTLRSQNQLKKLFP